MPDSSGGKHLWIIISDPTQDNKEVIVVNVTTFINGKKDPSCLLESSDHPDLSHQSCINYAESQIAKVTELEYYSQRSEHVNKTTSIASEVLMRIRQGAQKSIYIPYKIQQRLIEQGIIAEE